MLKQYPPEYAILSALCGKVLCIEGPIGVGKSTLGEAIISYCNRKGVPAHFYPECVDEDYKKLYLKDHANMAKHAFGFQKDTLERRINVFRDAQKLAATGYFVVIDRGVLGDISFATMQCNSGLFSEEDWACYQSVLQRALLYEPDFVLHLKCDAETAMDRVMRRAHSEEAIYDPVYMDNLAKALAAVLAEHYHGLLLERDWSPDLSESGNTVLEITDETCYEVLIQIVLKIMKPLLALLTIVTFKENE